MKNTLTLLIGIAVLVILLVYMVTFQVRYDQVAVKTTFNKALEPQRDADGNVARNADGTPVAPGSLLETPGLYFKAPWPIQKVEVYSKQVHLLEDRLEQITTSDGSSIVVKLFVAWRIEDPYSFFRSLNNVENAQDKLNPMLRNLMNAVSRHSFDQLVNTDASKLKLAEIEDQATEQLRQQLAAIRPSYGIRVEKVGISRIILPEASTAKVFESMVKTRERMAETARAEGRAQAATIESNANRARDTILAFAETRAQAIRTEGDLEAARYFEQFRENQDFAIFIDKLDALKAMLAHNTTFILDANNLWFLDTFTQPQRAEAPGTAAQRN